MNVTQTMTSMVDHDYLLRCAVTHDWDAMITVCEEPHHPHNTIVHACDQYGNSVIQLACYHRPPVSVIRSILNSTVRRRALVRHRATDASTALQVACATGASIEVIRLLVSHARDLVGAADRQGSTPISELTIQYALERLTPCQRQWSVPLDQMESIPNELNKEHSTLFRIFWTKLSILLGMESANTMFHGGDHVLCQAATLSHAVPKELTDLLLRSCSTATALPSALDIALHQPCQRYNAILRQRQEYLLIRLIQQCPVRDDFLSVAVRNGYSFRPVLHTLATLAPSTIGANLPAVAQYGTVDDIFNMLRLQPHALMESRQSIR